MPLNKETQTQVSTDNWIKTGNENWRSKDIIVRQNLRHEILDIFVVNVYGISMSSGGLYSCFIFNSTLLVQQRF